MQAFGVDDIKEWCEENGISVTEYWRIEDNPALTFSTTLWYSVDTKARNLLSMPVWM